MSAAALGPPIPRLAFDSTLGLLRDGYLFVLNRCRKLNTDVFETRLMLSRVTCAYGEDAARMFYHPGRFTRDGALPPNALKLLQDRGSVATLNGDAHRHRKATFLRHLRPGAFGGLLDLVAKHWRAHLAKWQAAGQIVLHDAVERVLCAAVCEWAGVPLEGSEVEVRAREFGAMIDGAGSVGPRLLRGLALRRRTERWARDTLLRLRETPPGPAPTVAQAVAHHRDTEGKLLDPESAAVELINVLRPTVAVARYVTFAAHALHTHPECRDRLRAEGDVYLERFVQEVRRFYPFFPVVAGRALGPFEWRGRRFEPGAWVMLDLYGTTHDPRLWDEPGAFRPDRFANREPGAFDLIPQGGGSFETDHRCPGEWATIGVTKLCARMLATEMRYDVPQQDLRIDLSRLPAIPASRVVLSNIRG